MVYANAAAKIYVFVVAPIPQSAVVTIKITLYNNRVFHLSALVIGQILNPSQIKYILTVPLDYFVYLFPIKVFYTLI